MIDLSTIDNQQRVLQRFLEFLRENELKSECKFRSLARLMEHEIFTGLENELKLQGLAYMFDVPIVTELKGYNFVDEFVEQIPIGLARKCEFMVLEISGNASDGSQNPNLLQSANGANNDPLRSTRGLLATSSYLGVQQLDNMRRCCRTHLDTVICDPSQIQKWINEAYEKKKTKTDKILSAISQEAMDSRHVQFDQDLLDSDGRAPIINLVNSTLFDAINQKASDVHLQPYEDCLMIRFRIDGVLFDSVKIPKSSQEEVLSRIKVIGKMNIAEKRMPQDGRVTVKVGNRRIDLRIASLPTSHGERIVIRLLDKNANLFSLAEVGMQAEMLNSFLEIIHREHGMILVTGPTGAGKSTTLYAALQELNTVEKNVVTLEDPIEYQLEGVSQTQINLKKGLTFAKGLRNVLRQDPDIIMVGEIRDEETAEMAVQSALTGHLVFSTLHTNDAVSSIARLMELGIEPYLVANSIIGILAQRLVRRICLQCSQPVDPMSQHPQRLGKRWYESADSIHWGTGCDACRQTGYLGRIGVYELMVMDVQIREQIQGNELSARIRDYAMDSGNLIPLIEDGITKVMASTTTVDEVARVAFAD